MMTTHQLKAARALLDWTQQDLAKASGMHLNVINNIERGISNPRQSTLEKLKRALEENGVAFIGTRGVELKREAITVTKLEGEHAASTLVEDILKLMPDADGEVLILMADIRNFDGHAPEAGKRYQAEKAARGFKERLMTRAMPGFYPRGDTEYKVLDQSYLGPVDKVIYGDRVALIVWDAQEITILKGANCAETERRAFNALWTLGHEPVRALKGSDQ